MKKADLYILLATLVLSSAEVSTKLCAADFHPVQFIFTRFLVGGLVLLPFARRELRARGLRFAPRQLPLFLALGFLGISLSMPLYQLAVLYMDASRVAVLYSTNPVFVAVLACLILKEPLTRGGLLALGLEIGGILVLVGPFSAGLNLPGIGFTLLATLTFSLYTVLSRPLCARYGGVSCTCLCFFMGSGLLGLLMLASHLPGAGALLGSWANIPLLAGYTAQNLGPALFVYVVNTGLGFAFYFQALGLCSAQKTSLVFFFKPVLASLLAVVLLGESLPFHVVCGILLILMGSAAARAKQGPLKTVVAGG